jgi:hypothetical protein
MFRLGPFFAEAGLNQSQLTPVDPGSRPSTFADYRAAWRGTLPNRSGVPFRIEAAALQGKPFSFEITGPWTGAAESGTVRKLTERIQIAFAIMLLVLAMVGGIFFARKNLRLGRGDRRNATRLAFLVMSLYGLSYWFTLDQSSPLRLLPLPWYGGLIWMLYLAIEPSVRRRWPQILVDWTRLFSGDWRDPLVARNTLIGCAFAVLTAIYQYFLSMLCLRGSVMPSKPPLNRLCSRFSVSAFSHRPSWKRFLGGFFYT